MIPAAMRWNGPGWTGTKMIEKFREDIGCF